MVGVRPLQQSLASAGRWYALHRRHPAVPLVFGGIVQDQGRPYGLHQEVILCSGGLHWSWLKKPAQPKHVDIQARRAIKNQLTHDFTDDTAELEAMT